MSLNIYILTYNRASCLQQSIGSVLKQSYKDFNLYILDNCSQDHTSEVVNSFCDSRIHYIRHNKNIGGIGNSNFAINHCEADYFVMFHDDDVMLPNFIEKEISIMESNENIAVVSGNAEYMGDSNLKGFKLLNSCGGIYSGNDVCKNFLKAGRILVFPSLMYRTSFIKDNNIYFKEKVGPCADVVFYCDIGNHGGIIYELSDVIMQYRIHATQASQINKYDMNIRLFNYFKHSKEYCKLFYKNRCNIYVRWVKTMLVDYLSKRITGEQLIRLINKFKKTLIIKGCRQWDIAIWFTFMQPSIMRVIYRIYCNIYKKPIRL